MRSHASQPAKEPAKHPIIGLLIHDTLHRYGLRLSGAREVAEAAAPVASALCTASL